MSIKDTVKYDDKYTDTPSAPRTPSVQSLCLPDAIVFTASLRLTGILQSILLRGKAWDYRRTNDPYWQLNVYYHFFEVASILESVSPTSWHWIEELERWQSVSSFLCIIIRNLFFAFTCSAVRVIQSLWRVPQQDFFPKSCTPKNHSMMVYISSGAWPTGSDIRAFLALGSAWPVQGWRQAIVCVQSQNLASSQGSFLRSKLLPLVSYTCMWHQQREMKENLMINSSWTITR